MRPPRAKHATMKIASGVLVALLLCSAPTFAQSGPGGVPVGAGTQRGVQEMNNSGQAGFVTLFDHGAATGIVVFVEGTKHRVEPVTIQRGQSCDAVGPQIAAHLPDIHDKISRGTVHMTQSRLLSGNYVAVVFNMAGPKGHPVACGQLYE